MKYINKNLYLLLIIIFPLTAQAEIEIKCNATLSIEQVNTELNKISEPVEPDAAEDVIQSKKLAKLIKQETLLNKHIHCAKKVKAEITETLKNKLRKIQTKRKNLSDKLDTAKIPEALAKACKAIVSQKDLKNKSKPIQLKEISREITCLLAGIPALKITETDPKKKQEALLQAEKERKVLIAELIDQQHKIQHPSTIEERVSNTRIISDYELGIMKLPDYEDGENNGFTDTKGYFDINIDGRFEFDTINLVINSTFNAMFMSTGAFSKEEVEAETANPFPNNFNDVSDTLDAGISFRLSAMECSDKIFWFISCLSASNDGKSSFGLVIKTGFQNREKKLINGDTVNNYYGVGFDYRSYDDKISYGTNRTPNFSISYLYSEFEEYGFNVIPTANAPCTTELVDECIQGREDAKRHVFKLNYRIHDEYPFYLGFRANLGKGQDDYGLTLGIRKTGEEMLSIFGYKAN
ncbi:hypothetical protein [Thalassomonas actiniarum]|uniref:Uncharacterized protein n=1 Tax=Thalassomonas actiniarum TaxID=485447 RepID=A0AAE9YT70_9GAMM|nr:hypothetical protein [Thalassomonas actiniarum]WDE00775.1 hypothetical protein SG35_009150 [Thalassomonas actiniarum]